MALHASDIWILPQAESSSWFAKIDWYLNWQMSKGLAHETRRAPNELLRLAEENGLPWITPPDVSRAPLLVACRGRIPSHRCLVVPPEKSLAEWLKRVFAQLEPLRVHSLRVFLPQGATITQAQEIWRSFSSASFNVEFTSDEESTAWPTPTVIKAEEAKTPPKAN